MKAFITIIFSPIFLQSHAQPVYIRAGKKFGGNQILNDRIIAISYGLIDRLHLLMNGITSIIDMGAPLKSYRKIVKTMADGKITGSELYYPGPLITVHKCIDVCIMHLLACLITRREVLGLMSTLFAPMQMHGLETTLSDTMHALHTGVCFFLCMFPAIGFGITVFRKQFLHYSIGTMLIFSVFGIISFLEAQLLAANLPTPWLGIWERVNIFGYQLWIMVLAIALLKTEKREDSFKSTTPGKVK